MAEVRSIDEHRARTQQGRDDQVLIEADRIRDGLTSRGQKQQNNRK